MHLEKVAFIFIIVLCFGLAVFLPKTLVPAFLTLTILFFLLTLASIMLNTSEVVRWICFMGFVSFLVMLMVTWGIDMTSVADMNSTINQSIGL